MLAEALTQEAITLDVSVLIGLLVCSAGMGAVAVHGGMWVLKRWRGLQADRRAEHALAGMLRKGDVAREIDASAKRLEDRPASRPADQIERADTMVRARVDHMREVQSIWGSAARHKTLGQVAEIMRRSVRRAHSQTPDSGDAVFEVEGHGFTILMRGAQEADTGAIAKRLRRELARSRIDGLADNLRITASFGLAGRRKGESYTMWRARAETALKMANARGEDQIVEASFVEEVKLLPPPSIAPSPAAATAQAA